MVLTDRRSDLGAGSWASGGSDGNLCSTTGALEGTALKAGGRPKTDATHPCKLTMHPFLDKSMHVCAGQQEDGFHHACETIP